MPLLTPADIEAKARSAGLTIAEVCRRAEIAQSTFWRWKHGATQPSIGVYGRLCSVIQSAEDAA